MHITLNAGQPQLINATPGVILIGCTIKFDNDRNNQLILGSGKATIVVSVPGVRALKRLNTVPVR